MRDKTTARIQQVTWRKVGAKRNRFDSPSDADDPLNARGANGHELRQSVLRAAQSGLDATVRPRAQRSNGPVEQVSFMHDPRCFQPRFKKVQHRHITIRFRRFNRITNCHFQSAHAVEE